MGIVARLRLGLAVLTVLACSIAFVGIQRIVQISSTAGNIEEGTGLLSKATGLLATIDQAEEAVLNRDRTGMRDAVKQTMATYGEFRAQLLEWTGKQAAGQAELRVLEEKLHAALQTWQAELVRMHTRPETTTPAIEDNAVPPKVTPVSAWNGVNERRTRINMRRLLTNLLLRLESDVASVRADAAAGIRLLALLALAVVGGAALIARGITFQLSQPLHRIETVLEKVALGELHRRSGINSTNEIGRVGLAVDKMLSRVEFHGKPAADERDVTVPEPAIPVDAEDATSEGTS